MLYILVSNDFQYYVFTIVHITPDCVKDLIVCAHFLPTFYILLFCFGIFNLTHCLHTGFFFFKSFCDYSLNMAGKLMVILNGFDVMKEAFVKKADVFSDRSPIFFDQVRTVSLIQWGFQSESCFSTWRVTWCSLVK